MCARCEAQPKPGKSGRLTQMKPEMLAGGGVTAFEKAKLPIILNSNPDEVVMSTWNFTPGWNVEQNGPAPSTYNARIETIDQKPTYAPHLGNRCLVVLTSFQEGQERIIDGKKKKFQYKITKENTHEFCVAGIYRIYKGEIYHTVITTEANELMAKIHNTMKRMPVILEPWEEKYWLEGEPMKNFADRANVHLEATPLFKESPQQKQGGLFD